MKICFGTFANVLLLSSDNLEKRKFLNTLVWSVDPTCILTHYATTKLLQCDSKLPDSRSNGLGNVISAAFHADPSKVAKYFEKMVAPLFLTNESRKLAVLAIRNLIVKDKSIGGGIVVDKVSGKTKNGLQMQCEFVFSDFLAGVFLFTALLNNKVGIEHAKAVDRGYVSSFTDLQYTISIKAPQNEIVYDLSEEYSPYLERVKQRYKTVKNLLYKDDPKLLYDFYVPNYAVHSIGPARDCRIENVTAKSLMALSNFLIVEGSGGLGKTMMMQHLLVDTVDNFSELRRIPIFLPLKDYKESNKSLSDFVFSAIQDFYPLIMQESFTAALKDGLFLLLFDGLDEIDYSHSKRFEYEIVKFSDRYPKNCYVISTRPFRSFTSFARFSKVSIHPFTKAQALALVDKLDFQSDKPEVKQKFRAMLDETLYETHRNFVQNPLMLTLMLMMYDRYAEVPTKIHQFFHNAFLTMSKSHDAAKGAFKRKLKTGLKIDDVEKLIAEISFRAYCDEKYEFTESEFKGYFDELSKMYEGVKAKDFLCDLQHSLCIIYAEGDYYQFIHRSFQEYFAAVFISKQTDVLIGKLGEFFDKREPREFEDAVFPMLYDIAPEKVEQFIFVPYLKELFNRFNVEVGYLDFLEDMYPTIHYSYGEVPIIKANRPRSYIYEFLLRFVKTDVYNVSEHSKVEHSAKNFIGPNELPFYADLIDDEVAYETERLLNLPENSPERYKESEFIGHGLRFDVAQVRKYPEAYAELLNALVQDGFVFKHEFTEMHKYLDTLINRIKDRGNDLSDLLWVV